MKRHHPLPWERPPVPVEHVSLLAPPADVAQKAAQKVEEGWQEVERWPSEQRKGWIWLTFVREVSDR